MNRLYPIGRALGLFAAIIPLLSVNGQEPTKGGAGTATPGVARARLVSAVERKEIATFLQRFSKRLKERELETIAKEDLQYHIEVDDALLKREMPTIKTKLEKTIKEGAVSLLAEVLTDPRRWYVSAEGKAIIVGSPKTKGALVLVKNAGSWRCESLKAGRFGNLQKHGVPAPREPDK